MTLYVRFKQDGTEKRKSLKTTDNAIAEEYAKTMYSILGGNPDHDSSVPEPVRNALGLMDPKALEAINVAIEALPDGIPEDRELTDTESATYANSIDLAEKLNDERNEKKGVQVDNAALRKRVAALEAMLAATGNAQLKNVKPKKLEDAITDYLAHNTGADERSLIEYKNYLNTFRTKIEKGGAAREISTIAPTEIIDYLAELKERIKYIGTIRKISFSYLCDAGEPVRRYLPG